MERSRTGGVVSFLAAAAIPILVTGAALMVLIRIGAGSSPTAVSTLLLRMVGGVVVSAVAVASMVAVARLLQPRREVRLSPAHGRWRGFVTGALAWLLPATLAFLVLAGLGARLTVPADLGQLLIVSSLVLLAVLLSEAVPEELLFRGWLTDVLGERLRPVPTIAIQTAIFTAGGLALRGWTDLLDASMLVAMGVGLGYLRLATQNVWTAVGFHTAFQTGSQLVLTHQVIDFGGSSLQAALALGMVPFGVGCVLIALLAPARPALFRAS